MGKCLLTVVIPTYNRAETLRTTLSFVIPQVLEHKDEVHIYISNNASTDNTEDVIKELRMQYPELITYFRQEENTQASQHFNNAVHRAENTEFVYFLSDDDIIVPECISFLLKCIKENPSVDYFYLNQYVSTEEMDNVRLYHSSFGLSYLKTYETGGDLLMEQYDGPSCISANLFRRKLWVDASVNMKKDCPGYVWLSILLHGAVNVKSACVTYPMFVAKMPKVQRYSANWPWYYVKGLGQLFLYLNEYHPGLYNVWVKHQQVDDKRKFLQVLTFIANDKKLYRERGKEIKPFLCSFGIRIFYNLLVTVIPAWIATKVIGNIIRATKIMQYI